MFKVIADSGPRQTALRSMLLAGGAALVMVTAWYALASAPAPLAVQRDISDVTLDWRCMHGHRFRAAGSFIELPCPECGEPSQAVIPYVCAGHGRQDLEVRFGPPRHRTWPTVLAVRS
ncbi:MAG TPA: hypothetical protein VGM03_12545, partial [Phycisphaerae bacterium]